MLSRQRRACQVTPIGEAEAATLYTADGLSGELKRLGARAGVHSIAAVGSDVLANAEYMAAVFAKWTPARGDARLRDALAG